MNSLLSLIQTSDKKAKLPSVINDPFSKSNVTQIFIAYCGEMAYQQYWYAKIEFTNGNTKGEQTTPNCNTFEEVMQHIKAIEESL